MTKAREDISQQFCQHLGQVIPAAILTAAAKAAEAKEQAIRRRHQLPDEAQIFSDGFAIGTAFLLQVGTSAALTVLLDQQHTIAAFAVEQLLHLTLSSMSNATKKCIQAACIACVSDCFRLPHAHMVKE